ncbi:MAG: HAD family phosphatase [Vicinamibacterales bacterium]
MQHRSSTLITTVIFDFDGVLADTEGLHLRAFQDIFATRGWNLDEAAYFDRYLGCDDRGLVVAYAHDHAISLTDADIRSMVDAKAHAFAGYMATGDVLFRGARDCVAELAGRYSLGIASGALHVEIVTILQAGRLLDAFRVIVGADDVASCKPSPEPYLTAAARLGVAPSACVAVEDSAPGLQAAQAAGMRTIGMTTTSPRHLLAGADRVIGSLQELSPALIEALGTAPRL